MFSCFTLRVINVCTLYVTFLSSVKHTMKLTYDRKINYIKCFKTNIVSCFTEDIWLDCTDGIEHVLSDLMFDGFSMTMMIKI